jgi:hypothetical protein
MRSKVAGGPSFEDQVVARRDVTLSRLCSAMSSLFHPLAWNFQSDIAQVLGRELEIHSSGTC